MPLMDEKERVRQARRRVKAEGEVLLEDGDERRAVECIYDQVAVQMLRQAPAEQDGHGTGHAGQDGFSVGHGFTVQSDV